MFYNMSFYLVKHVSCYVMLYNMCHVMLYIMFCYTCVMLRYIT